MIITKQLLPSEHFSKVSDLILLQKNILSIEKDFSGTLQASFQKSLLLEKEKFSESHLMLLISMGQKKQQGKYLQATVNLVRGKFKSYTLIVCDTLQRHNIMCSQGYNEKIAHQIALHLGRQWTNDHCNIYMQLGEKVNIIYWDKWLVHKKFGACYNEIDNLFNTNFTYRAALIETAEEYSHRLQKRLLCEGLVINNHLQDCCINYLKEECAAMLLWADKGYNYELYPNERNLAMKLTYELLVQPSYPNLLQPLTLRFKRNGKWK